MQRLGINQTGKNSLLLRDIMRGDVLKTMAEKTKLPVVHYYIFTSSCTPIVVVAHIVTFSITVILNVQMGKNRTKLLL